MNTSRSGASAGVPRRAGQRQSVWSSGWLAALSCGLLASATLAACTEGQVSGPRSVVATQSPLTLADAQALCAAYPGKNIIVGTDGDDVIDGTNKPDCIVGGRGNDRIQGGNDNDVIFAGEGNDNISGDNGNDILFADVGDDTVSGGSGNDTLFGGAGNDRLSGGNGDDILHGEDGADWLNGENGTDTITGDNCYDRVVASNGSDAVNGGMGTDVCSGTACELALTTPVCTRNADCAANRRCVVASGVCVDTNAEHCESAPTLPDGGTGPGCNPTSTTDATCNGIDDDCNGSIDEDYARQTVTCGVGACQRSNLTSCVGGTVVNACTPGTPAPNDTTCDGIDDNCNGTKDEGFASSGTSCGVGHCAAHGNRTCVNSAVVDSCMPGAPAPSDTTCDAVDDDCDGALDENYLTQVVSCGAGACAANGTRSCSSGMVVTSCTPGSGSDSDTICNGIDDDCDGRVDEEYESRETACGVGACASHGSTSCVSGAENNSCTPGASAGNDANCDGIDSDCDSLVDENYVALPTQCGAGECARTGATRCLQGVVQNTCSPGSPAPDDATCNGADDDCDGIIDENYAPHSVSCGAGACAATGTTSCSEGHETASCTPGTPSSNDVVCNGIDDNCDGTIDEDYAPVETSCGVGACKSTGMTSCAVVAVVDSCQVGQPAAHDDTCNGIDDDCDGVFDEEFAGHATSCGVGACASTGATSCGHGVIVDSCSAGTPGANDASCNGIDDDCDSRTDEAFAPDTVTCGAGACAASGTTSCTQGHVVNSCLPGSAGPNDSVCNGIDDDCNSVVDEDFVPAATSCGVGVCASTGTTACVGGTVNDSCTPGTGAPNDPTCDALDDDCSGTADEDYASHLTTCGVGACSASGPTSCVAGHEVESCVPHQPAPSDANCDGVDDNCNGSVDEGYVSLPTDCGIGACIASGQTRCEGGHVVDGCTPGTPAEGDETCDGIDDDCGGADDEDYEPVQTTCGVGVCAATGMSACVDGHVVDSCVMAPSSGDDTSCNDIDDNCNGTVDEGYVPVATSCGVGACARTGMSGCLSGAVLDSCTPGMPAASDTTCDGVDDDCNGVPDDAYVVTTSICLVAGCQAEGHVRCVDGVVRDDCTSAGVCAAETDCGDGIDNDHDGAADCVDADCGSVAACAPAADPSSSAPLLDTTAATPFYDVVGFITTGSDPIQRGVVAGAIVPAHAALIEGHVRTREGTPLAATVVSVVGRPELGTTRTRIDGDFVMIVPGGAELLLRFEHAGYLPLDRAADPAWRGSERLDAIVLTPRAATPTMVDTSGAATTHQVVRGSTETDRDGARRATLLFPPSIEAQLQTAMSGMVAQPSLTLRVTELSVGPTGSHALPGRLPGSSAFLYAVSVAADEAFTGGAQPALVDLSQPVPLYLENFAGLPAGTALPLGAYDPRAGRFEPAANGVVIAVLSVDGGVAALDANGDGAADSAGALAALGISDAERTALAGLYTTGQTLWRLPVSKLGTWDVSPGPGPMPNAKTPPRTNIPQTSTPRHAADVDVPVAGTEFVLHYSSDRVLGYGAGRHLDIDLGVPTDLPAPPHHVRLSIAPSTGHAQNYRFLVPGGAAPASDFRADALPSDRVFRWDWLGLDLASRVAQGTYSVEVTTSYEYACGYRASDGFGRYASGATLPLTAAGSASGTAEAGVAGVDRGTCLSPQRQTFRLEQWDQRALGLGGFSLSAHHVSLPDGSVLFGDGRRSTAKLMPVSRTLADPLADQSAPFTAVPLAQAAISPTGAVRAAGDGSIYVAAAGPYLHRIGSDGLVTTIAGGDPSGCETAITAGSPALAASSAVCRFDDIAVMPDGDVVAIDQGRIVRIDSATGTIAQLNQGSGPFSADGTSIADATLEAPSAIAVDAAGRIFFADCGSHPLVRMIDELGRLVTVAGSGASGNVAVRSKVDARSIPLSCVPPGALEVDDHGSVYFALEGGNRGVLQVDSAGQIVMLGGYDGCASPDCVGHPSGLELDRKGNVYVAERGAASVFRYTPGDTRGWSFIAHDESFEQVYGNLGELTDPRCNRPAGTPSTTFFVGTRSDATLGIAVSPDGSLYAADSCNGFTSPGHESLVGDVGYLRTRRLDPAAERFIASPDGARYYVFDGRGRHVETRDASTNGLVYSFGYDSAGRLMQIVDSDGNTTAIARDGSGAPTAIVAPFGQQTALHANTNGYLDSIRPDASVPAYALAYVDARGLLATFTTPRGTTTQFGYDAIGVLSSTTDAVDVTRQFVQSTGPSSRSTTAIGPSGTTTVSQQRGDDGRETRFLTKADGSTTTLRAHDTQHETVLRSDGTRVDRTRGEDARWGASVPAQIATTLLPSGLRREAATYRGAVLASPNDPATALVQYEQIHVNDAVWSTVLDVAARARTTTSPEGRISRLTMDEAGRPLRVEQAGRNPVEITYDAHGRFAEVTSVDDDSPHTTIYNYSSTSGYLESTADGAGESTYVRDSLGRVLQWTRPDGNTVAIGYGPNGDVLTVTPPGKPAHTLSYTPLSSLAEYAPPASGQSATGSTVYEYTADRRLKRVLMPDGRFAENEYGEDGKLQTVHTPLGTRSLTYNPITGGLRTIADDTGSTLSFGSDGQLPNIVVWDGQGHVRGWVARTYDANFRTLSLGVNGATIATFARDRDGLTTHTGQMAISRDASSGDVTATVLGAVNTAERTNLRGEVVSYTASYQGNGLYAEEILAHDAHGRIIRRRESLQGIATEFSYEYDAAGRLWRVSIDGTLAREYVYDANGNRAERNTTTASETCSYDEQDRLTNCGDTQYVYNAAGQLSTKTSVITQSATHFDYDVFGNLRTVTLPSGRAVEYEIDGHNRRIGKRVDGSREWGLLYKDELTPVALVDAHNTVVSVFVYATRNNVPDYMSKNGQTYRFVVDHLGTVRMLVNVSTGAIAQRLDYDEFGNVLMDSNPGFQPFGFAGGIFDRDTGLVRFGARDYESMSGRWTAKDPLIFGGGDTNLYSYVGNDPINRVDPAGLTVYRCRRVANIPLNVTEEEHNWIYSDEGYEYGLGACGAGVPGQGASDYPGVPVCLNDHAGQHSGEGVVCEPVNNVDEECVNQTYANGGPYGFWFPLVNDCQTTVRDILEKCTHFNGTWQ
jgi:RHS repeat-associated protein